MERKIDNYYLSEMEQKEVRARYAEPLGTGVASKCTQEFEMLFVEMLLGLVK